MTDSTVTPPKLATLTNLPCPHFGAESEARVSAAEEISAISELTFHSTVLAMLNRWKQVNPGRVSSHTTRHATRHDTTRHDMF